MGRNPVKKKQQPVSARVKGVTGENERQHKQEIEKRSICVAPLGGVKHSITPVIVFVNNA